MLSVGLLSSTPRCVPGATPWTLRDSTGHHARARCSMSSRIGEGRCSMLEPVLRCPICGELMPFDRRTRLLDCPSRHRATSDPEAWRSARTRMLILELEAYQRPADTVTDHEHHWVVVERTPHETLYECVSCVTWYLGAP